MLIVILLILTALLWGTTPILEKTGLTTRGVDPLLGLTIRSIAVAIGVLLITVPTGWIKGVFHIDGKSMAIFVISGIMAGLLGMWTYYGALRIAPASKIVPIAASYPLVTAVLGVLILGEQFTLTRLAGTILIVVGIWLVI